MIIYAYKYSTITKIAINFRTQIWEKHISLMVLQKRNL